MKEKLRLTLKQKAIVNKSNYDPWVDHKDISGDSWKLLKSIKPEEEDIKIHFNRLLHNTLPTKAKLFPRIERELNKYHSLNTLPSFWAEKHLHIKDNLCTFCKAAPETMDHLHACTSPAVTNIRCTLVRDIKDEADKFPRWMAHSANAKDTSPSNLPIHFGSRGLIPKSSGITEVRVVQTLILRASLKIWQLRCINKFTSQWANT